VVIITIKILVRSLCWGYYNSIVNKQGKGMTSREFIKLIKADGWYLVAVEGSHHQFKHPTKKGRVTVGHPKKDIKPGTLKSMFKQAGLEK
jgi:predicted RNA binding protein YcfA (HicA-like mRNA interferase family)